MGEWDISQRSGAIIMGLLGVVFGIQKAMTFWKKGEVEQAGVGASKSVIDGLHEEFKRINTELDTARTRQEEMNQMIHQQAVKLTRMELLLYRMYGLLNNNNIMIPDDLRSHMNELLSPDITDRRATPRTEIM